MSDSQVTADARQRSLTGGIYAVVAFTAWATLVHYWKMLGQVPALEVMLNRAVWSVVFILGLLALTGRLDGLARELREPRRLAVFAVTAALLAGNWYLFIWSVQAGRALEASLGYYINPLVNVLLGVIVLNEKLSRPRQAAVALAALGVTILTVHLGVPPWIALLLAGSFGLYGLLRKMAPADPLVGFAIESLAMAVVALPWLAALELQGQGSLFRLGWQTDALLLLAGVVTALPLIWFNAAAKRLTLSSLGLFQYIAPTGMFVIAVFAYGETFTTYHLVTFGLIWAALVLVAIESIRTMRRQNQ
ncbi:EamA family transporter RarD [Oleomonas cavernae]|uniref:EamA family transporter RarD n=1 Tax=Oleomonas cavernae TaxID=2320859 RepID=A0A418WBE8_9PROT|nr:EamA family transporter RarD [Oleomonas cavernae]RJF87329.1 EamA family transporter RarD [Oleomonas cavernae]